jgi:6-phosphogluconolactonase
MRWITLILFITITIPSFSQDPYLFVGTYTNGKSKGIYVYRFNTTTGTGTEVSTIKSDNPSYLAIAPDGKHIYSANESGTPDAYVGSYSFDPETGKLFFLNKQSSQGNSTCYISEDKSQKWVVVANYGSGSLAALPVNSDGSLAPASQVIQHSGSGINKNRQAGPHVHSTIFSPDEKYLYAADLGTDKEYIYHFDPNQSAPLTDAKDSFASVTPGSGPRHIAFHPSCPFLYLISDMAGTMDAFLYDVRTV